MTQRNSGFARNASHKAFVASSDHRYWSSR